ncbi:hypothetical protein F5146DRAFT_1011716 [Armillaria mellea]|nr:hypothetical protein F5146DRAFT_1011716 [Armillaria mellea]
MASYPLRRIPAHRFNKPSWLMAPDPSMLPIPVFNGTASFSVQRQSLVVIHATLPVPSHSLPSTEPCVFPPPPTYAEVMDMDDDLPLAEAMRRARAIDPIGYVAEAVHPEDLLPPSFDDISRMEPHLPWEEVMKRAGNIDQAALIRDTISRQGPDGLVTSFEGPSDLSSLLGPQTVSHRLATGIPETITESYNQLSMNTEEAARSLLILSSSKDRIRKELITFSKFITIWLHATITNRSMTQPATESASLGQHLARRLLSSRQSWRHSMSIYPVRKKADCSFRASAMGIDRRTADEIGRHVLHGLGHRLDISPNDWKASLEDLHRFAATSSFPTGSDYTRTVITNILDELKIDAPPGIPLRARTSVSEHGSTERPSITHIEGIFTGAIHSPRIILKAAEARPAAPWNAPNDSVMGHDTRHNSASMQRLDHRNRRDTAGGRVSIQHSVRVEKQSFSMQGDSAGNRQPLRHTQCIQPDDGSFGMRADTRNDLSIGYGAPMMAGWDRRPNIESLKTQPPLVSRSVRDRSMIWQSDNGISGQRPVSGGLIFRGPNETNIWAPQRGEYPSDRRFPWQGNQIGSRTSLYL